MDTISVRRVANKSIFGRRSYQPTKSFLSLALFLRYGRDIGSARARPTPLSRRFLLRLYRHAYIPENRFLIEISGHSPLEMLALFLSFAAPIGRQVSVTVFIL